MDSDVYVEGIPNNNAGNPFGELRARYKIEEIQRLTSYGEFKIQKGILTKIEGEWQYAIIKYIVNAVTVGELYNKIIFFLVNPAKTFMMGSYVFFDEGKFQSIEKFSLKKDTVLLSGVMGDYCTFNGSVYWRHILKCSLSPRNGLGQLHYITRVPIPLPNVDPEIIKSLVLPENMLSQSTKHVAEMDRLDSDEVAELQVRGVSFVFLENFDC